MIKSIAPKLIFIFLLLGVGVLALRLQIPANIFLGLDNATDYHIAKLFLSGDRILLGPPSFLGGRHPGPIYYWFSTALYWIGNFDIQQTVLLCSWAKLVSIFLLTLTYLSLSSKVFRWWGLVGVCSALISPTYIEIFRVQWQSNYLVLASSIAFLSAIAASQYGPRSYGLVALGLTVLFHSHLSSAPVVLGLGLAVLGSWYLLRRDYCKTPVFLTSAKTQLVLLALTFLMWLPVLYHEFTESSNFLNIFQLHSDPDGQLAGSVIATSLLFEFIAEKALAIKFTVDNPFWLNALFFFVALYLFVRGLITSSLKSRVATMVLVSPLILTTAILTTFKLPLHIHYFNSSLAAPALIFGLLFQQSARDLSKMVGQGNREKLLAIPAAFFIAYVLFFVLFGIKKQLAEPPGLPATEHFSLQHATELGGILNDISKGRRARVYTALQAKMMRNSYPLFLDSPHYGSLEYREFFWELDTFSSLAEPEIAFLVMCPKPFSAARREIEKSVADDWIVSGEVDLSRCGSCTNCSVSTLERRADGGTG